MKTNSTTEGTKGMVSKVLQVTAVTTVLFFIIFSITKRFLENDKFYLIPLVLFLSNFLILIELIYRVKTNRISSSRKEFNNLIGQSILNLSFVLLVISYLI